jgi:dipeptidase
MRRAFRFHYDNTDHDPYLHSNPKEPYRPVSIFRTTQTHLLQVRPELPSAIGCITYMAEGMADLGVFLPLYEGVRSFPKAYRIGDGHSSKDSAYWIFRKVMTLGMVNYNEYAPLIKETYAKFEAETDQRQKEMETEYLKLYKQQPMKALDLLQDFSDCVLNKALETAGNLTEELFTRLAADTQKTYLFHGA